MNAVTAVLKFAMAHPYISTGIVLAVSGGVGYGAYKLADKGIDVAGSVAKHAIDHALDAEYSFEFQNVSVKPYAKKQMIQTLPATC